MYVPILKFINVLVFEMFDLKVQISLIMNTGAELGQYFCANTV